MPIDDKWSKGGQKRRSFLALGEDREGQCLGAIDRRDAEIDRLLAALAAETTARKQAEAHAVALQRIIDEHRAGMARAMPPRAR